MPDGAKQQSIHFRIEQLGWDAGGSTKCGPADGLILEIAETLFWCPDGMACEQAVVETHLVNEKQPKSDAEETSGQREALVNPL